MSRTGFRLDRASLAERFRNGRRRSREFFDSIAAECYRSRPIPLRNPIVFYEGHLPAFNVNTLLKTGLGRPGLDAHYETLFERGIDPEDEKALPSGTSLWPSRDDFLRYAKASDAAVLEAIAHAELDRADHPPLARAEALFTIVEHE